MANTEYEITIGNKKIKLPVEALFTLELPDKFLLLLHWGSSKRSIYNTRRNIWCFNKTTGEKLWEIQESSGDKNRDGRDTYVGFWVHSKKNPGTRISVSVDEKGEKVSEWKNEDYVIQTRTFCEWTYDVDLNTGKTSNPKYSR